MVLSAGVSPRDHIFPEHSIQNSSQNSSSARTARWSSMSAQHIWLTGILSTIHFSNIFASFLSHNTTDAYATRDKLPFPTSPFVGVTRFTPLPELYPLSYSSVLLLCNSLFLLKERISYLFCWVIFFFFPSILCYFSLLHTIFLVSQAICHFQATCSSFEPRRFNIQHQYTQWPSSVTSQQYRLQDSLSRFT